MGQGEEVAAGKELGLDAEPFACDAPLEVGGASTSKEVLQGVTDRFTDAVARLKDLSERARAGKIVKSI